MNYIINRVYLVRPLKKARGHIPNIFLVLKYFCRAQGIFGKKSPVFLIAKKSPSKAIKDAGVIQICPEDYMIISCLYNIKTKRGILMNDHILSSMST